MYTNDNNFSLKQGKTFNCFLGILECVSVVSALMSGFNTNVHVFSHALNKKWLPGSQTKEKDIFMEHLDNVTSS